MELTDAQAAEHAARGDADAFMLLVRRYRAPLIAYIHGQTRARSEAEDIAQETFCKAWQQIPTLRQPGAFGGWLFRIARNAAFTAARRPQPTLADADPPAPACPSPGDDRSVEVHAAVATLADEFRIVVSLRHFSGMSNDEIARVLGIPSGTVRSRLSRAYSQLRERLVDRVEV